MTLSDKLTRDQVRDAFNRNLTYADLCGIDIRALQGFIAIECARHDRKLASKGELLMLMQPSCLKKHAPNISASTERLGIYEAFFARRWPLLARPRSGQLQRRRLHRHCRLG